MSWKQERYFSGRRSPQVSSQRLPEDLSPAQKQKVRMAVAAVALIGGGAVLGVLIAPEAPTEVKAQLQQTSVALAKSQARVAELERSLKYQTGGAPVGVGRLRPADKLRHEREGRRYVAALRKVGAQGAAELMAWFIGRWDQLLDQPLPDDRTGRRAATLSLLIGGMAENLNPGDFVPWQAEFLNNKWLGELHFDIDGDGLPGKRSAANTHDGFANVSVCQIAMALNQSVTDAQVLVMPEMRCDRPDARVSLFLQGRTFDDALTTFVHSVREEGFLVVERLEHGVRLILVGNRPPRHTDE